jgi:small subunit ribosomal protein S13
MPRLLGVEIPNNKRIEYALRYIYGVGLTRAQEVVRNLSIHPDTRAHQLTEEQISKIMAYITAQNWVVEGDLRREISANIKLLQSIKCYRGIRHQKGLPVHGQRTSTNARTRKGKRRTIGSVRGK